MPPVHTSPETMWLTTHLDWDIVSIFYLRILVHIRVCRARIWGWKSLEVSVPVLSAFWFFYSSLWKFLVLKYTPANLELSPSDSVNEHVKRNLERLLAGKGLVDSLVDWHTLTKLLTSKVDTC